MPEQAAADSQKSSLLPPGEYLAQILSGRSSEVDRTAREEHILLSAARALVKTRQAEQFVHDLEASGLDIETYFKDHPEAVEGFRRLGLIE